VIDMRQAENQMCILLGMPVVDLDGLLGIDHVNWTEDELRSISYEDLDKTLGPNLIPTLPEAMKNTIVINLPADLLRQRPDVRAAERRAAAQGEAIGIAQADLYPAFSLNGTLGYQAGAFRDLFRTEAFNGSVGPSFRWNVLNYGRIVNGVRLEDARFREDVLFYQQTVLDADKEVEDGIVTYLRSLDAEVLIKESADASFLAAEKAKRQYETGAGANKDLTTYAVIQQNLVNQQNAYAQAQGSIAQGLIQIYRALGGGWEIRFAGPMAPPMAPVALPPVEPVPAPQGQAPAPAPQLPTPQAPAPQIQEPVPTPNPNTTPAPAEVPNPPAEPSGP
jgi:cell division septation protein DedD